MISIKAKNKFNNARIRDRGIIDSFIGEESHDVPYRLFDDNVY